MVRNSFWESAPSVAVLVPPLSSMAAVLCVRACVWCVIHEASHVLSILPDKEGPCFLCVWFLCGGSCECVRACVVCVHVVCVCVCVCVTASA